MKETEQTLLDQIKDQVAKDHNYENWSHVERRNHEDLMFDIVCERYATAKAKASCEATLMRAAKNGDVDTMEDDKGRLYILQSSILDPSNIFIVP